MVDIRGHLAAAVTDLGTAMQTIDATLRATMDAASQRFAECQRDDKELMMRTEAALTHLGAKVQELEQEAKKKSQGGISHEQSGHARDTSAPQQHNRANVGHPDHSVPGVYFSGGPDADYGRAWAGGMGAACDPAHYKRGPGVDYCGAWAGGAGAACGPAYYNMASPTAYYNMASPTKEWTAPQTPAQTAAPGGAWINWQQDDRGPQQHQSWNPQYRNESGHARDASASQQHNRANVRHPDYAAPGASPPGFDPWQRTQPAPAHQTSGWNADGPSGLDALGVIPHCRLSQRSSK